MPGIACQSGKTQTFYAKWEPLQSPDGLDQNLG